MSTLKHEIRETFSVGIPLVASQLIYALSGFVGTAMVARLGEDALAASVLVSTIWMTLLVLFFGILNSVSVLVSHQFGAKNHKTISEIMGQAYLLGLIIAIIMVFILLLMPVFLRWSSQPPAVLELARQYMHALIWTTPGLIALIISEQFLAGINRTKLVLRISVLVVPIEIPLIYMLIFGKIGLPAFGVAGIGYGFAITYSITAIGLLFYLLKSPHYRHFKIFNGINRFHFRYFKELVNVGLPMGFMHVIEVSTFALATLWMGQFGTTMLAAHQIVMQFLGFAITLVFAMSQAVTIRVGHSVGEQNVTGVYYAAYAGMLLNFVCAILIALGFYLIPTFFLGLDIDTHKPVNADLVRDASMLLAISGVLLLFDNFRIIGFGALRGLKDTRFPMLASFISFWLVGLTCAYIFSFHFGFQGSGIWWGLTLGIAFGAAIVFIRLRILLKQIDENKLTLIKEMKN
ncbi:MATE family efflux transporter [Aquicella lusitana]|uniref:Multidrug-efflux transporter n=1 Tax=Aquicella lusitana TaxID=254246 RepID=A0A370GFT9_9COXI|nr:MATE family efflux transporter [Aquicella lusitana]RDI42541.1 MATE family multidrug resistance protein [Aquicella lusitana]VVC74320.1 Multidrug resistance protein NorM [Aquicella lusitana]